VPFAQSTQVPNTVYLGAGGRGFAASNNEILIHVGPGATGTAARGATGFAESGGLLTVQISATGIVSAGATVTALSGGTARLAGEFAVFGHPSASGEIALVGPN
jgi:hypothetical protein